ncbi:MAG: SDR family oxidoreductase [Oscillospiraceae bacterium]|nr:SDR family oxidoreductase [Oscillospiraceae bacterium]
MELRLRGKTALVTGGSKGIGAGCCTALAEEGCSIIVNFRSDPKNAEAFARGLSDTYGIDAIAVKADVSCEAEVEKLFEAAYEHFGAVQILINNAAATSPSRTAFQELTTEEWRAVQEGTLNSAFFVSRKFAGLLIAEHLPGSIINVLSKSAILSSSIFNSPYVSAKGGLMTLTRSMAKELVSYDIRVNGIVPGYVRTEKNYREGDPRTEEKRKLLPLKDFASPNDMGSIAAFLCSDRASQINGAIIDCTGGTLV